uniref:G-protein coupled receptors family 1 profile domain-containing protein n=1 Tax=Piliocolobus tephrosceles TaxID=591936 RepID=A0A8C9IG40_9PRIM
MRNLSGGHVEEFVLGDSLPLHPSSCSSLSFFFFFFFCNLPSDIVGECTHCLHNMAHSKLSLPLSFFLGHLSFLELWYINVTIPQLLAAFLTQDGRVSYVGCMTQLYFFIALACTECVLLAVTACDCYLAICGPLRYPSLMPSSLATRLAAASWGSGFFSSMMKLPFISQLSYLDFLLALVMILLPLLAVVSSYAAIIAAVLRVPTSRGHCKAFSTCATHLAVVVIYYSSTLFTYAQPQAVYTFNHNKIISVLYTIIVPSLNPVIYCLRNKEVKDVFRKTVMDRCHYPRDVPD